MAQQMCCHGMRKIVERPNGLAMLIFASNLEYEQKVVTETARRQVNMIKSHMYDQKSHVSTYAMAPCNNFLIMIDKLMACSPLTEGSHVCKDGWDYIITWYHYKTLTIGGIGPESIRSLQ